MPTPLIVTRDEVLLEELLRLSAAAGVVPEVAVDAQAALSSWGTPPIVLVGADVAGELAGIRPPRRVGVHVVSWGVVPTELFRIALQIGAEHVAELPHAEAWVMAALSDLDEGGSALTVGVIGGSGGVGASTFATAMGQVARGPAMLLDLDPLGAGLDRVLGCEAVDGVRWDDLYDSAGRLSAKALRDALPRRGQLGVLTWAQGPSGELSPAAVREAISAAQRGHDTVVIDLPRFLDPVVEEVIARCDHIFVVVQPSLTGIASAVRVCGRWAAHRPASLVVRRPGLASPDIARILDLPVAVEMGSQRGLDEALVLGIGPVRSRRGPLARAALNALGQLRQVSGGSA
jgi:secretion/DNA translocation related CpaE-like protein